MATNRKPRTDSVNFAATAFATAATTLKPTKPLKGEALLAFQGIIASRETASWMPHDLRVATELACLMERLSALNDRMATEEPTLESSRGTPVANPIYSVTMQLSNAVQAVSRALGLTASHAFPDKENQDRRNQADKEARGAIAKAAEAEGLL